MSSRFQTYTSLAPKWYLGEYYIEVTFFGGKCAIVKKVNWTYWHDQIDKCVFLMNEEEQEFSITKQNHIKHFWRLFRGDRDSVDPPFYFERVRVTKRTVKK